MARKKKAVKININQGEGYCRVCFKVMPLYRFYETTNPMIDRNGYMSVCKDCANDIYQQYFSIYGNMETALHYTCMDLDVRFSKEILKNVQSHIDKLTAQGKKADRVFGYYKSKLTSIGKNNEGYEKFRYRDSDVVNVSPVVADTEGPDEEDDFELTPEILEFWGRIEGYQKWHYKYLVDRYSEYIKNYECDTPAMEELLKQAAFESLEIQCRRMKGEDASKNLSNLQNVLASANIKPVQETGANAPEKSTFGVLIKKWEEEEPIPEPDEEWKDVDGIGKYIRIWFLGHLCKILGIKNEFSEEYEAEMAKLRVEMPVHEDEDDWEEEPNA